MLSDRDVIDARRAFLLDVLPWSGARLQSASVDVTLGDEFMVPIEDVDPDFPVDTPIDPRVDDGGGMVPIGRRDSLTIQAGGFVLGCTQQSVTLSNNLCAVLDGKSSVGRLALMVHITAGFVDPGWSGPVTLELFNLRRRPLTVYAGMPIGQLRFLELRSPAAKGYGAKGLGSKYVGATGVQASRMHRNFELEATS